jgi:THO complex subunit 5
MMVEAHTGRMQLTLNELRDYADTVVAIKAKGDASGQLPAACAAGTALLLRAREQERLAALQLAGLKEESASQRNRLDHDSLQLHNLVYEQQYYDKEIAASRAFKSAYTDDQVGCYAGFDPQQQSESDLLHAELQQRQALQQQLQQLQQQKEQLLRERERVANSYEELKQQVEQHHTGNSALVEATQPSRSNIQADAEAAQLLPLPLYIIYTQAAAAGSVVGLPLSVSIEGNPAVAKQQLQQQLQQQQQQQQGSQPGGEDAQAAATAAAAAQDAKRKRKQLQQEDQAYQVGVVSVTLSPPFRLGVSLLRCC